MKMARAMVTWRGCLNGPMEMSYLHIIIVDGSQENQTIGNIWIVFKLTFMGGLWLQEGVAHQSYPSYARRKVYII